MNSQFIRLSYISPTENLTPVAANILEIAAVRYFFSRGQPLWGLSSETDPIKPTSYMWNSDSSRILDGWNVTCPLGKALHDSARLRDWCGGGM
jgi:hypothetical protein